jgi:uncharacterized protein
MNELKCERTTEPFPIEVYEDCREKTVVLSAVNNSLPTQIRLLLQRICLGLIRGYRYFLSPLLPPSCRFTPSCSCYAIEAIETHGTWRGLLLALGRIVRCQPFCQGGYDPVPPVSGRGYQGACGQRRGKKKSILKR